MFDFHAYLISIRARILPLFNIKNAICAYMCLRLLALFFGKIIIENGKIMKCFTSKYDSAFCSDLIEFYADRKSYSDNQCINTIYIVSPILTYNYLFYLTSTPSTVNVLILKSQLYTHSHIFAKTVSE